MQSKTKIHQKLSRLKTSINGGNADYSEDEDIPRRKDVSNEPVEEAERFCEEKGVDLSG